MAGPAEEWLIARMYECTVCFDIGRPRCESFWRSLADSRSRTRGVICSGSVMPSSSQKGRKTRRSG
jgi:hypothetical protein